MLGELIKYSIKILAITLPQPSTLILLLGLLPPCAGVDEIMIVILLEIVDEFYWKVKLLQLLK